MLTNPDFFDARVAGWWVWGISQWIGSGWCTEPGWTGRFDKRPALGRNPEGRGVLSAKMPAMDRSPRGRGANRTDAIVTWMQQLSDRFRRVRVCCGDWSRILGPSPTEHIGVTAVLLDPPYDPRELARSNGARGTSRGNVIYGHHEVSVSNDVRKWAIEHGDNPKLRIALCGYEGEHEMPPTWDVIAWKAPGGYAKTEQGRANSARERIWFSPHCLRPRTLFDEGKHE